MDQIEEISPDLVQCKGEQCIQIRYNDGIRESRAILTNSVSFYNTILNTIFKTIKFDEKNKKIYKHNFKY